MMEKSKSFRDHFSRQSDVYSKGRPSYPDELFAWLASIAPGHSLAWDVATGNGQAALQLTKYFKNIYASDASKEQIALAPEHPQVTYKVESAESPMLEDNSVDLITVAVAAHWFEYDRFYAEVKRVLKPGGIIAIWMYYFPYIDGETEKLVEHLRRDILKDHWPERYRHILSKYKEIPFPFEEIPPPAFKFTTEWQLQDLVNFFYSWSGTQRYIKETGIDPVEMLQPRLNSSWGDPENKKKILWDLYVRTGKI